MIPKNLPVSILPFPFPKLPGDPRKIVIVGGGNAGLACALALRRMQFGGSVTMINNTDTFPYDKKKVQNDFDLSKITTIEKIING
jgi:pyruvate/2-oxoglutarate dehydrogenase complex dihydrolipoamide dehydrogenase (E3) component